MKLVHSNHTTSQISVNPITTDFVSHFVHITHLFDRFAIDLYFLFIKIETMKITVKIDYFHTSSEWETSSRCEPNILVLA